jgi:hypothetical protein
MMLFHIKIFRYSFLSILLGGLIGCNYLANSGLAIPNKRQLSLTQIATLVQQKSPGSNVYLQGKVISQAPFLGSGAYQLQDASGQVWVITNNPLPIAGDQVLIEAQVEYQSIPVGTQDVGELYVLELQQLAIDQYDLNPVAMPSQPISTPTPTQPIKPTQPEQPIQPTKNPVDDLFLPHKQNQKSSP